MNLDRAQALALATKLRRNLAGLKDLDLAVCPPFVYLGPVSEALAGSNIAVGAQDVFHQAAGAYTGEISPAMLKDVGCRYAMIGHSERRHVIGEGNELINKKVAAARAAGLMVIMCVGELLEERQKGITESVVEKQVSEGLAGVAVEDPSSLVIAYEPVWAIGTGHTATAAQAQTVHAFIRRLLADRYGQELAAGIRIQYGGSVKPDNIRSLMAEPDVDGALVGGASLDADSFTAIARYRL